MAIDALQRCFYSVFAAVASTGLALNCFIIATTAPHLKKLPPSSFLIFWLCVFDGLAILNNAITPVSMLLQDTQAYSNLQCQVHAGLAVTFNVASLQTCFGLTLFRYLVIVHQVQLPRSFPGWYICGQLSYAFGSSHMYCVPNWTQHDTGSATVMWICFMALIASLVLLVFAYAAIFTVTARVVAEYRKTLDGDTADSDPERNLSIPWVRSGHRSSPENMFEQKRVEMGVQQFELMKQSLILVGAFLAGWIPYMFLGIYEYASWTPVPPLFDFLASMIVTTYETINPVIIMFYDREIGRYSSRALGMILGK
ncbi:hypothetical protein HDU81_007230 [Chytriomyces hyalinus]|nr:hypothetical protein HDU81_007230 [Chytriomyces hyalinus]